jgi:hypothetical protein
VAIRFVIRTVEAHDDAAAVSRYDAGGDAWILLLHREGMDIELADAMAAELLTESELDALQAHRDRT